MPREIDCSFGASTLSSNSNASASYSAPIGGIEEDHFDRIFNINVKGTVVTVQRALPLMSAGSSVVLTGSGAGSKGCAHLSIYSATRASPSERIDPSSTRSPRALLSNPNRERQRFKSIVEARLGSATSCARMVSRRS